MLDLKPSPDPGIYLLADHLDAALAAGEDLSAATLPAGVDREEAGAPEDVQAFVARLAKYEAAIIARILQARRRAAELPRIDAPTQAVIQLILSQSTSLVALIDRFGDQSEERFLSGDDPLAFLRERGLLAEEAAILPRFDKLRVTDTYRIAGVVELGPLLDMVAGALEALDLAFGLFTEDLDEEEAANLKAPPERDAAADASATPGESSAGDPSKDEVETSADVDSEADADTEDETSRTASAFAAALQSMQRAGPA